MTSAGGIVRIYTKFQQDREGLVPAPDSTAVAGGYFLKADGTWAANGSGDVTGPGSSTDNALVLFNGATGKIIKNSDLTYATPTLSAPDGFTISSAGTITLTAGGAAKDIKFNPGTTGNAVVSFNSTAITPVFQGLEVVGKDTTNTAIAVDTFGAQTVFLGRRANGTAALPSQLVNGNTIVGLYARGYDSSPAYTGAQGSLAFVATESWTSTAHGLGMVIGVTPNGGTSSINALTIENSGRFLVGGSSKSMPAWTTSGTLLRIGAGETITDNSSSGTVASAVVNNFGIVTFAASSATTFTNAATVYIAGDVIAGTNVALTNSYGLWNGGKTRLDGTVIATIINAASGSGMTLNGDAAAGAQITLGTASTKSVVVTPVSGGTFDVASGSIARVLNATDATNGTNGGLRASGGISAVKNIASDATVIAGAGFQMSTGTPSLSSSGGLSLKMGVFTGTVSNSTDSWIGVHNTGGPGVTSGDLVMFPRSNANAGIRFLTGNTTPTLALLIDQNQALTLANKIISYNGLATAGNGVATIQGAGRVTAQTAAAASVATYTVGGSDASFLVSANVLVTASTTHAFTVTVAYTDEGNTARTVTLNFAQLAGTIGTSIANTAGAVPYEGIPVHIRAKASTTITVATTGTFTSVTYNAEGVITKLQ